MAVRLSPTLIVLTLLGATALAGCGGLRALDGPIDQDAATTLPACDWPASLPAAGGSTSTCTGARAYLSCRGSNGDGAMCLSNDLTGCPPLSGVGGETFTNCQDLCHPNEYAVSCGGPGPQSSASPPVNCRVLAPTPGGTVSACCPCGIATAAASGSFSCGGSATCDGRSQICRHVTGGAPPGVDVYACEPIPTACAADVSCACVTSALAPGDMQCTDTGGDISLEVQVP